MIVAGLGFLMLSSSEGQAQGCLSSSVAIATPSVTPNLAPLRMAATPNHLGVVHAEFGSTALYFGRYTHALALVAPPVEILRTQARVDIVAFIFTGTDFGLFFNQVGDSRLRMMRISIEGVVLSSPMYVLNESFTSSRQSYDVKWDGAEYVIARTDMSFQGRGVWLNRISREGTIFSGERLSTVVREETRVYLELIGRAPVVLWNASAVLNAPETNYVMFVSQSGLLSQLREVPLAGVLAGSVVLNDQLVILGTRVDSNRPRITYTILNRDGLTVRPETDLLAGGLGESLVVQGALADREEIAIAYRRVSADKSLSEYRLRRMKPDFSLISDLPFSPDPVRQFDLPEGEPVKTTNSYVHHVTRTTANGYDSALVSQCPFLARLRTTQIIGSTLEPVDFIVDVSGGVAPYTVRWDFGDRFFGTGTQASHTYLFPGTYQTRVTVTDANGLSISLEGTAVIGPALVRIPPRRRGSRS